MSSILSELESLRGRITALERAALDAAQTDKQHSHDAAYHAGESGAYRRAAVEIEASIMRIEFILRGQQ